MLYSSSSKDAVLEHYNIITVPPGVTESGPPVFTFNAGLVSLSILFLVMSYGARVVTIYPPLSQAFDGCIRGAPMNFLEKQYQTAKDKASLPRFKYWNSFYKVLLLTVISIAEALLEVGSLRLLASIVARLGGDMGYFAISWILGFWANSCIDPMRRTDIGLHPAGSWRQKTCPYPPMPQTGQTSKVSRDRVLHCSKR